MLLLSLETFHSAPPCSSIFYSSASFMRFLIIFFCAVSISSTAATVLLRDSTQSDSIPLLDDPINLELPPQLDRSSIESTPNPYLVASNLDLEKDPDMVNLDDLTAKASGTDSTDRKDGFLLTEVCDQDKTRSNLQQRGTDDFCDSPVYGTEEPSIPENIKIPEEFVMPKEHAPDAPYDDDGGIGCQSYVYKVHVCCQGKKGLILHDNSGFPYHYTVQDCMLCKLNF